MPLLSDLYNVTLKKDIRGKAAEGFIRPTVGEFFMSDRDFEEIEKNVITDIIYSGSTDNEVHKIGLPAMSKVSTYNNNTNNVYAVTWGADDYLYLGGGSDGVHKINPSDMSKVATYNGDEGGCRALVWGIDSYLYSAYTGGSSGSYEILKIDPSDMSKAGIHTGHSNHAWALTWGADGHLYSGALDGEIHKIDPSNMSLIGTFVTSSDPMFPYIWDMVWGSDDYIYSASSGNGTEKIDPSNMSLVGSCPPPEFNNTAAVAWGTDGYIYSAASNELYKINPSNMSHVATYYAPSSLKSLIWFNSYLYSGGSNGEVYKINPSDMSQVEPVYTGHSDDVQALTCSKVWWDVYGWTVNETDGTITSY